MQLKAVIDVASAVYALSRAEESRDCSDILYVRNIITTMSTAITSEEVIRLSPRPPSGWGFVRLGPRARYMLSALPSYSLNERFPSPCI
jgi:hypothetical protein